MKRDLFVKVSYEKNRVTDLLGQIGMILMIGGVLIGCVQCNTLNSISKEVWGEAKKLTLDIVIVIGILILIFGISFISNRNQGLAFAIDEARKGIWIKAIKSCRLLYVPFNSLKFEVTKNKIIIKYSIAFYYKRNDKVGTHGMGSQKIMLNSVNWNELRQFILEYNKLVAKEKRLIMLDKQPASSDKTSKLMLLLGVGSCLIAAVIPNFADSRVKEVKQLGDLTENGGLSSDERKYDLKFDQSYQTRDMYIKFNAGYRAKTQQGEVAIFNVTFTKRKNYVSVPGYDFTINQRLIENKKLEEEAEGLLGATLIEVGNEKQPVINQLTESSILDFRNKKSVTANLVVPLNQEDHKKEYLIYSAFSLSDRIADLNGDDNTPRIFWKFNPQKLKELS